MRGRGVDICGEGSGKVGEQALMWGYFLQSAGLAGFFSGPRCLPNHQGYL